MPQLSGPARTIVDMHASSLVGPARPDVLALPAARHRDPRASARARRRRAGSTAGRQRALTRYYLDAGAGGLAVGVHTTQFAIRDVGLYEPVLELAARSPRATGPTGRW